MTENKKKQGSGRAIVVIAVFLLILFFTSRSRADDKLPGGEGKDSKGGAPDTPPDDPQNTSPGFDVPPPDGGRDAGNKGRDDLIDKGRDLGKKAGDFLGGLIGEGQPFVPEPEPEPELEPEPVYGQPGNPATIPTQGSYYQIKWGDNPSKVASKAGLKGSDWRAMRDHWRNQWIPTRKPNGNTFQGVDEAYLAAFWRWFDPPGYESQCYYEQQPGLVYGIVYVPYLDEV